MASFFIRRPIVAIVIAIITVLAGLVVMRACPRHNFPTSFRPK
jgi:multidrug efflux pump subunit AcrB